MKLNRGVLLTGAFGAATSVIMLVGMAFIRLPAGLEYPGVSALSGAVALSPGDQTNFIYGIKAIFLLDSFFLVGWLVCWTVLSLVVLKHNRLFGVMTFALGISGALLDFGENSIILGVLLNLEVGQHPGGNWVIPWKAVQHMSYWLPYVGALFAAIGLMSSSKLDRISLLVATLLIPIAAAGLYYDQVSIVSSIWFLVWFTCVAVLLWQHSKE